MALVGALAAWMLREFDVETALARLHRGHLLAIAVSQPLMVLVYLVLGWRFAQLAARHQAVALRMATRAMALSAGLKLPAAGAHLGIRQSLVSAPRRRPSRRRLDGGGGDRTPRNQLWFVATLTTLVVAARMAAS